MATKAREAESLKEQRKNLLLLLQLVLATAFSVGWLYGGYYYCDFIPVPKSMGVKDIWIYYTRCCVLPCAVVLLLSLHAVINKRTNAPAGNPLAGMEHTLQVEKNILTNTVEQIILFLSISLILATYLDQSEMKILPLYSSFWVIARLLFNIGYRMGPQYRSVGMLCNIESSAFFLGLVIYLVYSRGFWFGVPTITSGTGSGQTVMNAKPEL